MTGIKFEVSVKDVYDVEEELGRGGQAIVYSVKRKSDGKFFACKSIRVTDYPADEMVDDTLPDGGLRREAEAEIRVLQYLRSCFCSELGGKTEKKQRTVCPVVELVEVYREADYYHLIMEQCQSSLRDVLLKRKRLREDEAAVVIKGLANAVQKMHKAGVVHRDMKTGNVLLLGDSKDIFQHVKVADFGTAWLCDARNAEMKSPMLMRGKFGTERYIAPEVCYNSVNQYDERVDVWGVGIVMYEMLSGKAAFDRVASRDVGRRMSKLEDLPMSSLDWTNISDEARVLILQLLNMDPRKRISLEEFQKHPWVKKHCLEHQKAAVKKEKGEKRKRGQEQQVIQEEVRAPKIRLRCVAGAWQSMERNNTSDQQARGEVVVPKIRLKCINGAWTSVH